MSTALFEKPNALNGNRDVGVSGFSDNKCLSTLDVIHPSAASGPVVSIYNFV